MASRRGASSFLSAGLPFVTFIVGGSYMLSEFVSGQVHVKDVRKRSKSLREFDIEEEHRNIMKEFNEDFEIKRVPRPGE
eukprot:g2104.t2